MMGNLQYVSFVAEWLFFTSVKATVLIALILIIKLFFKDRLPAKWQYALWIVLLIRLVLPFEMSSSFSLFNLTTQTKNQESHYIEFQDVNLQQQSPLVYKSLIRDSDFPPETNIVASNFSVNMTEMLALVWLLGAAVLFIYLLIAHIKTRRQIIKSKIVRDPRTIRSLRVSEKRMGLARKILLFKNKDITIPYSYGLFQHKIVLPQHMVEKCDDKRLEHIFLHELAHIRRNDHLVALVISLVQIFYWFNPALWFAFFIMRNDREAACNELALQILGENHKIEYGETLISLLREIKHTSFVPVTVRFSDNKFNMRRRVKMISNFTKRSWWWSGLSIGFLFFVSALTLTANVDTPDVQRIKLTARHNDDIKMTWGGVVLTLTRQLPECSEQIYRYPEGFELEHTFFWRLSGQYNITNAKNNPEFYKKVISLYGQTKYDSLAAIYPDTPVDCMLALAILKKDDVFYVVADENNDENLSNDSVLPFKSEKVTQNNREVELHKCQTTISTEYFDGNKVRQLKVPIGITRRLRKNGDAHYHLATLNVFTGKVKIDGSDYNVAILPSAAVEITRYSSFWIDSNQNKERDMADDHGQLFKPFIMADTAFEATEIDPQGKYIVLKKSAQKVFPQIKIGNQAPNFSLKTLDSTEFSLSDLRGKFVLIDFWATWCGPCVQQVSHLKKVYEKYHSRGLEIVSIGEDDPLRLKTFIKKNQMNWIHIQQGRDDALPKLYQIGGWPTLLLLDKDGKILEYNYGLRGDVLEKTLARYM